MMILNSEDLFTRKELEVMLVALNTCIDVVSRECVVSELNNEEFDKVLTLKRLRFKFKILLEA